MGTGTGPSVSQRSSSKATPRSQAPRISAAAILVADTWPLCCPRSGLLGAPATAAQLVGLLSLDARWGAPVSHRELTATIPTRSRVLKASGGLPSPDPCPVPGLGHSAHPPPAFGRPTAVTRPSVTGSALQRGYGTPLACHMHWPSSLDPLPVPSRRPGNQDVLA